MNENTVIPMGYRLTIESWENDADAYATNILEGLTRERVAFLIALAEVMGGDEFGNMYSPADSQIRDLNAAVLKVFEKFPDQVEKYDSDTVDDYIYELQSELFGSSSSEDFYTRVLDSWKVEYIPHEVILEDVSDQFGAKNDNTI